MPGAGRERRTSISSVLLAAAAAAVSTQAIKGVRGGGVFGSPGQGVDAVYLK